MKSRLNHYRTAVSVLGVSLSLVPGVVHAQGRSKPAKGKLSFDVYSDSRSMMYLPNKQDQEVKARHLMVDMVELVPPAKVSQEIVDKYVKLRYDPAKHELILIVTPINALRGEAYRNKGSETNRWVWRAPIFLGVLILVAYFVSRGWNIRRVDQQYRVPLLYAPTNYLLQTWSISMLQKRARASDQLPVGPKGIRVSGKDVLSDNTAIRVYIYESQDKKPHSAALLWIHGGGLVLGNATKDTEFLELVLRALNIVVVSVEYRLAPQHPYPQPLNDCYAALLWMHDHADELGIDPRRIAIGGDSAGAGLAAALVQRAHDEGQVKPVFQALMYPMIDDRTTLTSNTAGRGKFIWTREQNLFGWKSYLGQTPTLDDERPYAAAARRKDLSGLPPAWIGVGDLDLFYDEDVDYGSRLQSAGVSCQLDVVPNAYHGFNMLAKKAPGSIDFNERMIAALRMGLEATLQP